MHTTPDNYINITAERFREQVTITVASAGGNQSSTTVPADHPLYAAFLAVADDELLWTHPVQPRDPALAS